MWLFIHQYNNFRNLEIDMKCFINFIIALVHPIQLRYDITQNYPKWKLDPKQLPPPFSGQHLITNLAGLCTLSNKKFEVLSIWIIFLGVFFTLKFGFNHIANSKKMSCVTGLK